MNIPFVDLKSQYNSIKNEITEAMQNVISDSAFIKGKYVKTFEKNFADYVGVKHCIGVGNGTDALYLSLKSLGIGEGDEVITVSNTAVPTIAAIRAAGAIPVFVDIDEDTYNMDPVLINKKITEKTKAILPVHLYGNPCPMDRIMESHKAGTVPLPGN